MSAQYPSIRRGKRAESLSSGGMMTPNRSKLRKSLVKANDTPGPPREYEVYVTAYCCSSGTKVMRGSSMPQSSSGYSFGLDSNVGSLSMRVFNDHHWHGARIRMYLNAVCVRSWRNIAKSGGHLFVHRVDF